MLLGLALAIDAAVVTFAVSLMHEHDPRGKKLRNGVLVSGTFGLFQFLMLWLGAYGGHLFTFSSFGYYFQVVVGLVFLFLAVKCAQDSFRMDERHVEWGVLPVIVLAFVTSIDALASGISFGTIPEAYVSAAGVGVITAALCGVFYFLGQFFQNIPDRWLLRVAGAIFIFLSGKVFWTLRHIFFRG
jgi:putative Mn2+ efflux pump MntP